MLSLFLSALFGLILFVMGYYFGNQIGSTRHIRKELAKIRTPDKN